MFPWARRLKPAPPAVPQRWSDLVVPGLQEGSLVGADLMEVEVVDSGIDQVGGLLDQGLGIRSAGHRVGDHLLGDDRRRLLEVLRCRQVLAELPGDDRVAPDPVRLLDRDLSRSAAQQNVSCAYTGPLTAGASASWSTALAR